jgi:hypothetical protein
MGRVVGGHGLLGLELFLLKFSCGGFFWWEGDFLGGVGDLWRCRVVVLCWLSDPQRVKWYDFEDAVFGFLLCFLQLYPHTKVLMSTGIGLELPPTVPTQPRCG